VCVSIEPPSVESLFSLNAEQAYAPTIPSAYRLQRAGSTYTNAAVGFLHMTRPYQGPTTAEVVVLRSGARDLVGGAELQTKGQV
jgi:hypothetical protein